MKLRQISFKIISLIMVFAMMFGISATTISAVEWTHADHDHSNENDKIYYVSLGDSMSNGYGLPGYDMNSGVEDYGEGSYANQFATWLGKQAEVDHTQLAMSAMRAEDLHWLLELDYTDAEAIALAEADEFNEEGWNAKFTTGDYWTWNEICTHSRTRSTITAIKETGYDTEGYDGVALIAKYYQDAVKNADVMSLGMGNGNFGVFMFGRIMEAIGFSGTPDDTLVYNVENAIRELDPEMQAKVFELKTELEEQIDAYLAGSDVQLAVETADALVNTLVYTVISYVLNYAGSVEAMLQLNPDADIILVALMNTFASENEAEGISIGDLLDIVYTPLNAFIAALPTYMQYTNNSVYDDATFYYAEAESVECIVDTYATEGLNNTVRDRFVESIVDGGSGMVWKLLAGVELVPGTGITVCPITLENIQAYESAPYAVATTDKQIAVSCAVYLAFEDAIVAASQGSSVSVESILGLKLDPSLFGSVMTGFSGNIGTNAVAQFDTVCADLAKASGESIDNIKLGYSNGVGKENIDLLCTLYAVPETLSAALQADPAIAGLLSLFARCVIGNGIGSHPSQAGHDALAEAVINAYSNGYTAKDETVNNALIAAGIIADLVVEYHDEAFAYAHAELRANGTIDEINAALDAAIEAVEAAREAAEALEVTAEFAESKTLLVSELALTEATLAQIKVLVNIETLSQEHLDTLETLLGLLVDHLETIGELTAELAGIGLTHLNAALMEAVAYLKEVVEATVEELKVLVNELTARAYAYIVEMAPVAYEKFVNAVVEAVKYYSHEAAEACYYWLLNNPETVIGFFDQYGDDIVDVIVDNYEIIFGVLGFVGATYGDEIVELVLNNADVIFPAIVYWFEIHGDLVWDLVVVYFNAIVEYYELGIDFDLSTPEGILEGLNKVVGLLGELLNMVVDGVYDYIEALGIVEKIEAELAKLDAYIRETVTEQIETIKAIVEAKIEAIKAEINAKIEALEKALEDATGDAKEAIKAELEALKAELEALVNAEIENLEDAVAALQVLVKNGVKELGELIAEAVLNFVDEAVRGEFTPTEDTYYVSVNGGDAYYAELLAGALSENLESPIKVGATTWDNLDYEMLAKADLVTIGYDENELTGFAVNQLLAYVANYVDVDLRTSTNDYVVEVFAALNKALHEIVDGKFNVPFDFDDYKGEVLDGLNGTIDGLLSYELIAGRELADMDWAKYVGEENLHYVDEARAALRAELVENGVIESYTYTVDVVDYLYANGEELGIADVLNYINKDYAYEVLGENAYYTVEVPVADAIVFAAESYLYGNVEFNYNYGKLIVDLYKMNPEATVILLGHYNAYDVELALGDVTVDLSEAYGIVAGVASVHPFGYALVSPNVAYVDIYEAETVYESYVAAGLAEGTVLEFLMMYLADSGITDASEAGNVYIYEQILNILTVGCDHKYDNGCDETCNKCGAVREVAGHVYDNACDTDCNECGAVREVGDHEYDENGECIHCGASQITPPVIPEDPKPDPECLAGNHYFDDCDDRTCYKCSYVREELPAHEYDDCEDVSCNKCGKERAAVAHVYDNACDAECNRCGADREVAGHVYSGCTDTNCNVCGAERSDAKAHVVDDCEDTICNECGQNVAAEGHKYGEWTVTEEASRKNAGKKVHVCTVCNHEEIKAIAALGGIGAGAIVAIVVGSVVVAGAAGFAIYWFLIQKKTFADLLALINKPAAGAEAPAAETPAEAETPTEEAPATEAETPTEEAPAAEEETK